MKFVKDIKTEEHIGVALDKSKSRVHIYRHRHTEDVVAVPDPVVGFSVGCVSDCRTPQAETGWVVYILTDKQLYCVTEIHLNTHRSSKKHGESNGNQEIFSELLGSNPILGLMEFTDASHDVYQVTDEHALLDVVGHEVVSLAVGCGVVAIASSLADHYIIQVYLLVSLQTQESKVPIQTYWLHKPSEMCGYRSQHSADNFLSPLSLHLITTNEMTSDVNYFSSVLDIPADFYRALCGFELSLLTSPLLLICPPEGSVYYTPMKSLDTVCKRRSAKLFCHTHCGVVGVGRVDLCVSTDPLQMEGSVKDQRTGLVITSGNGKALLATDTQGLEFVEISLPGPVVDVDTYDNKIYHSTGTDVYETILELTLGQIVSFPTRLSTPRSVSLMYAGVQQLACLQRQVKGGECDLMLRANGHTLKTVSPNMRRRKGRPRKAAGQTIRDLLQSISVCSEETERLQRLQAQQADMLHQVSIAASLCTLDPSHPRFPLAFSYSVCHTGTRSRQNNDWLLACHMTNKSDLRLSGDWTMVVTIEDDSDGIVTSSFPIPQGIDPGQEVVFHVLPSHLSLLRPLVVRTNLLLHPALYTQGPPLLNVPVATTTMDILYGLVNEGDLIAVTSLGWEVDTSQMVRDLASSRPTSRCGESTLEMPTTVQVPLPVLASDHLAEYSKEKWPLLRYLLASSKLTPSSDTVTMVTVGGHKVQLTTDHQTPTIYSRHADVAIATRCAILKKFQELAKRGDCTINPQPSHGATLQHLEKKLQDLQTSTPSKDVHDRQGSVVDLYLDLRSTIQS